MQKASATAALCRAVPNILSAAKSRAAKRIGYLVAARRGHQSADNLIYLDGVLHIVSVQLTRLSRGLRGVAPEWHGLACLLAPVDTLLMRLPPPSARMRLDNTAALHGVPGVSIVGHGTTTGVAASPSRVAVLVSEGVPGYPRRPRSAAPPTRPLSGRDSASPFTAGRCGSPPPPLKTRQPFSVSCGAFAGCLWTLVAPPGYNVSAAVSMGAWGRGGPGVVHLYAQTASGELSPVLR